MIFKQDPAFIFLISLLAHFPAFFFSYSNKKRAINGVFCYGPIVSQAEGIKKRS